MTTLAHPLTYTTSPLSTWLRLAPCKAVREGGTSIAQVQIQTGPEASLAQDSCPSHEEFAQELSIKGRDEIKAKSLPHLLETVAFDCHFLATCPGMNQTSIEEANQWPTLLALKFKSGSTRRASPFTKHKRKKELTSTAESGVGIGLDNEGTFAVSQQKTIPGNMSTTRADKRARHLKSDNF